MVTRSNKQEYAKGTLLPDSRYIDEATPVADPVPSTSQVAAASRSTKMKKKKNAQVTKKYRSLIEPLDLQNC